MSKLGNTDILGNLNISRDAIVKNLLTVNNFLSTGSAIIDGDLIVNGSTTTLNTSVMQVQDKDIVLAEGTVSRVTSIGAGILIGSQASPWASFILNADSWSSSENINIVTGKTFKINGTDVLSNTTLGSSVTSSSLTSVGTITTGVWNGSVINSTYGGTGVNNAGRTLTISNANKTLAGAATSLTFAGNFTTTGAFTTTLAQGANVTLTLPTSSQTLSTLAGTETFTNKTHTAPRITSGSHIADSNGNELINFPSAVANAVNELYILNSVASSPVSISTTGNDTNIGLTIGTKGSGIITLDTNTAITGNLTLTGASTISTSTGNLTVSTGAANGNIILSPHGSGIISSTAPITIKNTDSFIKLEAGSTTDSGLIKYNSSTKSIEFIFA